MAKKKAKSKKVYSPRYAHDDKALMILAGVAALIVGFFAIFAYKTKSVNMMPNPVPSMTTVTLDIQNKSGEKGVAALEEVNGKVVVTLNLTGFVKGVTQPAHIHVGACPTPGAVKYPLTSVVNGVSKTTLNVTMAELKAMEPLAINVHKSVSSVNTYVSCGDLNL